MCQEFTQVCRRWRRGVWSTIKVCCCLGRYEELKHQLEIAQEAAHEEDEEAELARATAAVARLTAPAAITETDLRLAEELTNVAAPKNGRAPRPKVLHCFFQSQEGVNVKYGP